MIGCPPCVSPCSGSIANCITLDRIVIAPTARSPPYFNNEELKHNTRILSVDCMINGAAPRPIQGSMISFLILKFSFFSLRTVSFPDRKRIAQTALIACERTVASAAPCTPISNPKIKIGSRTIFVTAPITTVIMLILENPCAAIKAFSPSVSCTKIVPTA